MTASQIVSEGKRIIDAMENEPEDKIYGLFEWVQTALSRLRNVNETVEHVIASESVSLRGFAKAIKQQLDGGD